MRYLFDHDYHIHSGLSLCSGDREQSAERILKYAVDNGLRRIIITDHFWDGGIPGASDWYKKQDFAHIAQSLPLPKADGVEFLFGCETEMDKFFTLGISRECFEKFDFVIIPTNHLHMNGFTITPEDKSKNEVIARLCIERLDKLLDMDLPFHKIGLAHLACSLLNNRSREDYLATLDLIPDSEWERVFKRVAAAGCGVELNMFDVNVPDSEVDTVYRMFRIAKKCGCKFYLGTDAHHPGEFENASKVFERAISILGLTEDDKFHISNERGAKEYESSNYSAALLH